MADNDVMFDEDNSQDEEELEWEDTDEGIELTLDCTKCSASLPFVITWDELIALGEGANVKGYIRTPTEFRYRYTCPHCMANYTSANYSEAQARTEATSTIKFSLQEFTAWQAKALGRQRASQGSKSERRQRLRAAMQQSGQAQTQAQPQPQPAQPQPQPDQQGVVRRKKGSLTPEQRRAAQAYMRQLAQQGLGRDEVLRRTKAYMQQLQQEAAAKSRPQPVQQPRQAQQQPAAPQPRLRKARESSTGRIVLVNEHNQIVRYLS